MMELAIYMNRLDQFSKQKYLNLETFRKNGEGVRTPVWFVQEGEKLYVVTMAGSGKVKRIHRDGHVNVAACRMDGRVVGAWLPALACQITDPGVRSAVDRMLEKKYGLLKRLFERQRLKRGSENIVLEITLEGYSQNA